MRPLLTLTLAATLLPLATQAAPPNVVLFVADGLRPGMVNPTDTPAMAALMAGGVRFANTHSMFPTFTTPNASAMATGHKLGDTGDFSNTIDAGFEVPGAGHSLTPFLESDPVLGDVDEHYAGDYLNQETVMAAARLAGMSTATIGKLGPSLIFDHTARTRRADHRRGRQHRPARRHPAQRRHPGAPASGRPGLASPDPRPQCSRRGFPHPRHPGP